jgi:hypothetical protein
LIKANWDVYLEASKVWIPSTQAGDLRVPGWSPPMEEHISDEHYGLWHTGDDTIMDFIKEQVPSDQDPEKALRLSVKPKPDFENGEDGTPVVGIPKEALEDDDFEWWAHCYEKEADIPYKAGVNYYAFTKNVWGYKDTDIQ